MKKCKADDIYNLLQFLLAIILSFAMLFISFLHTIFHVLSFMFQNIFLNKHYCACMYVYVNI